MFWFEATTHVAVTLMTGPYLLPDNERTCNTTLSLRNTIKTPAMWTSTFDATFFSYCTKELNQLNDDTTKIESIRIKKKTKDY